MFTLQCLAASTCACYRSYCTLVIIETFCIWLSFYLVLDSRPGIICSCLCLSLSNFICNVSKLMVKCLQPSAFLVDRGADCETFMIDWFRDDAD